MRRRKFLGIGVLGLVGAGTCSWWTRSPDEPLDLVRLTSQQSRTYVPAEVGLEMWAVLRVIVDEGPCEERPPVHVGLVIDTSASMEGAAIEAARAAATELVQSLQDGDRLTVVTFDSRAELLVANVELDDDARDDAIEAIERIEARGTTDLGAGLAMALSDLMPHAVPGRVTRLVLLSDGVPNDASNIDNVVYQASAAGITVTALGFGLEYDELLLASIAQRTGGTFHFLETPDELVPIFREQTLRLQGIAAQEIMLTLITGPDVDLMEVVGQGYALPQPRLFMSLGDLSRSEERVIVVRLRVGPHRAGSTVELLDGQLSFRDPKTGQSLEREVFLSAKAVDDAALLAESLDPEVEREIESAKAAALTLHAIALSRDGRNDDAVLMLQAAAPAAKAAAERLESDQLESQWNDMNELANALEQEDIDGEPAEEAEQSAEGSVLDEDRTRAPRPAPGSGGLPVGGKTPALSVSGKRAVRMAHGNAMDNFQARSNLVSK